MSMTRSPRRNSDRPLSKCCCRARSPLKNGAIEIGMIDIMSQKTAMWQMERSGPVQPSPQCRREGWPKGRCPPVVPGGYMRFLIAIVAAALTGGGATLAVAQHQHGHDMSAPGAPDSRQLVKFPPALIEETLANRHDHLQPPQDIQRALAGCQLVPPANMAKAGVG